MDVKENRVVLVNYLDSNLIFMGFGLGTIPINVEVFDTCKGDKLSKIELNVLKESLPPRNTV